jgi:Asp-tRNA(Asn)/Glu-tRNA(Gln) amidotransferase A subunit family amidase
MPYQGVSVSTEGQQHVPSAIGPMARSISSLSIVTKAVIEAKLWELDAQLPPMPWKDDVYQDFAGRSLVIGIMPDDGVVKVHPPIERVFNETVAKLQEDGHEMVQWDTSLNAHCVGIMVSQWWKSGVYDRDLMCPGRVLHRGRRRRHTSSCHRRRRAISPACPSTGRSGSSDIRVRILATQQEEGGSTASVPQDVG